MKKILMLCSLIMLSTNKQLKYCDIKGAVNNPGVYVIKDNYKIENIINDAGGLKDDAYTDNINLSKKVSDEMVIYISSNSEIEHLKSLNKCNCEPIYKYVDCEIIDDDINDIVPTTVLIDPINLEEEKTSKANIVKVEETTKIIEAVTSTTTLVNAEKININTCGLEELLSIKGLGEKKAQNIINYRLEFGLFSNIEEILKVNGIGDATFKQIKDYIKV